MSWYLIAFIRTYLNKPFIWSKFSILLFSVWLILLLCVTDWTFLESPLSVRAQKLISFNESNGEQISQLNELDNYSVYIRSKNKGKPDQVETMYKRIIVNRKNFYSGYSVPKLIDTYAKRYGIDTLLMFYWLYLDGFYGKATSGPVSYFRNMTSETFRHVIQIRLPAWFVDIQCGKYLFPEYS